jgi:hypothetical protein
MVKSDAAQEIIESVLIEREFETMGDQMKKALILSAIVALGACVGGLIGQETPKPYSYTLSTKEGVAVCTFTGISFDKVWAATTKNFLLTNWKTTQSDKASGTITALSPNTSGLWYDSNVIDISLMVEEKDGIVTMTTKVRLYQGSGKAVRTRNRAETTLFENVAGLLYGPSATKR